MYHPLSTTLGKICTLLQGTGLFQECQAAAISNAGQLWQTVDAISLLPCAIVLIGGCEFSEDAMNRELTLGIAVFDEFKAATPDKAAGMFPIIDAVCELFVPEIEQGTQTITYRTIDGMDWFAKRFSSLDSPEHIAAFGIDIAATELSKYVITTED